MIQAITRIGVLLTVMLVISTAHAEPSAKFVPFHQVELNDLIWQPRIQTLVRDTLPHAFRNTEVAQRRLQRCAEWLESGGKTPKPKPHPFNTSDLYKVMEGAALMIQTEPNPAIESFMDRIIDVIARAQADDGYLYIPHITGSINEHGMGKRPYSYLLHSHELYNVGHLYEAAVAYAQATGKTELLKVAEQNARHVQRVIFEGHPDYNQGQPVMQAPGHEEIELGLVKLYHFTGNQTYLDMAKRFLDIRGVTFRPDGRGGSAANYAQQHAPVAEQRKPTGHAVRATYLYAAMAEVDSLTQQNDYSRALNSIWSNIVNTRMHITGGLGAVRGIEGFGPEYQLPNKDTYLETCAAVGNVFFNLRMFLKYRDAKYVDVAEVALLNNCLSGMGANGTSFFYPNPLEADYGHAPRSQWFGTACCPSNLARLIPQVPGYLYATEKDRLYCTLYGTSKTTVNVAGTDVEIRQTTDYPWSGDIQLEVFPTTDREFAVCLRIPTWATSRFVPGDLYHYVDATPVWKLSVNAQPLVPEIKQGFAIIHRRWKRGDKVRLQLPMPLRTNTCVDRVQANRSRVCLTRGPIVMCAEGVDNHGAVQRFFIDPIPAKVISSGPRTKPVSMLDSAAICPIIAAKEIDLDHQASPAKLKLIPYYAWSNRDQSSMQVWFPTHADLAKPDLSSPQNLRFHAARASHTFGQDTVQAVRMRHIPKQSSDRSIPRWTSWPQVGKQQWVEIQLDQPKPVSRIGVYFYDDQGGVQLPKAWHVEVPDADGWHSLEIGSSDTYQSLPDTFNSIHPATTLMTDRIRIVMTPQHDQTCVGILSVEIDY